MNNDLTLSLSLSLLILVRGVKVDREATKHKSKEFDQRNCSAQEKVFNNNNNNYYYCFIIILSSSLFRGRTNSGSSTNSNHRSVPTSTFSKRYRSSSAEGRINYNTSGSGLGRRERHQQGVAFLRSRTPSPKGTSKR